MTFHTIFQIKYPDSKFRPLSTDILNITHNIDSLRFQYLLLNDNLYGNIPIKLAKFVKKHDYVR